MNIRQEKMEKSVQLMRILTMVSFFPPDYQDDKEHYDRNFKDFS
jgi:hypothetical protein